MTAYKTLLLLFILSISTGAIAADFGVGQKDYVFNDVSRSRKLTTHVWYPTDSKIKTSPILQKGNPFLPVVVAKDASLSQIPKRFPVVLLSHGSGGKADKLFWLAERLVQNGIIVVGVDHPGNMLGDNSADGMMRTWERPKDFTFALSQFEKLPEFNSRIDSSKIGAAGHSAGGTTVLLLGGGRFSAEHFKNAVPNCGGTKDPYFAKLCTELKSLDIKSYDKDIISADYSDKRVKAVVSLDPGFAQSFDPTSFKKMTAKSLVLAAEKLNTPQDEIYSKDFLKLLPSQTEVVPNSFHMTFLSACKPDFPADDPELKELCVGNEQKLRIPKDVSAKTLAHFQSIWRDEK